ncbi:hypothetical protein LP419_13725 [Massilia sp. H-1]|nr:hypothetical protein LP419_13725 [Massilia sp. H-1]
MLVLSNVALIHASRAWSVQAGRQSGAGNPAFPILMRRGHRAARADLRGAVVTDAVRICAAIVAAGLSIAACATVLALLWFEVVKRHARRHPVFFG